MDYFSFESRVETVIWGKASYTVLPLPTGVADHFLALGAKRVEREINEHPVNLALTRAPAVDGVFLWAGQSLLDRVGLSPGEPAELRLQPAPNDAVDLAPDVHAALVIGTVLDGWNALTPGKWRGLLYHIDTAKTEPTRKRRIAALVKSLSQRQVNPS